MSSLIVEVCKVDEVTLYPNADKMSVARIKGWYICVAKDVTTGEPWCKAGDKVVYFPPDSVLTQDVADKFGVTKYLGALPKNEDGTRPPGGRVLVANLRSFKSYGFAGHLEDPTWEVGKDVAEHYKVNKYEPPLRVNQGDVERPHPAFHRYFDMENIRNFPDVIKDGEEIAVTEKIHGENCRLGLIQDRNDKGEAVWKWMAGTHDVSRKKVWYKKDKETGQPVGDPILSAPWQCFTPEIRNLLCHMTNCGYTSEEIDQEPPVQGDTNFNVVLFGERYGCVQDLHYGYSNGAYGFRAFDVTQDGKYADHNVKTGLFQKFGVEQVPVLWNGPYSFEAVEKLAEESKSAMSDKMAFREGVIVTTVQERPAITERKVMERAQVKCISFAYLNRKDGTEFK